MRLAAFQDAFAAALAADEPRSALPQLAAQPGFAVYRNTVMKGCIDALQANYPAVARLVGEEWFRAAAAVYARTEPPAHASLLDYGAGFAHFLASFAPAAKLPYLPQVARLDRFWSEAHAARDEAPVPASAVVGLGPEELARTVLRPHASARWAWFADCPAYTIWQRNRGSGSAEPPSEWRGEGALIVRPLDKVEHLGLDAAGCAFLDACAARGDLAAAAQAALTRDARCNLALLMKRLLEAGAFGMAGRN